ncbi:multidrug effflux MFS transporter [Afipia birgiae]|jgi:DHA1 family bicyclomycin/chloramphenicol resistance-like MFS transporter|uniref:multidrug effflux MFS transporter n=1 Tax=Afipia birgiae TaxID=151414 RepID=UPI0002E1AF57|nr:multidrug effflux MFS transporter [Afipia birgiae]MBX9819799.1 multidrug effflux MFS transporter [Afipia birgiae]
MTIENIDSDKLILARKPFSIFARISVLAALAAVGSFATNILLPSLPSMARDLNVSTAAVSSTISVYLAVFAVGQLIVGPLSDRYGRWKPVMFGLGIFVLGSLWCEFSTTLPMMLVGRTIQALGACAASVLSRAIARDLLSGEELTRALAFIMVAMAAAPGFSPLIGGLLDTTTGWRSEFLVVGLFGATVAFAYFRCVGETHRPDGNVSIQLTAILRGYWGLLTDRRFIAPAGTLGLFMGALFAMFSVSPRVLIDGLGFSPIQLGLFFATTVLAVFASGMAGPRLAIRFGQARATIMGLVIAVIGGVLLFSAHWAQHSLWTYLGPIMVFLTGFGMVNPLATATALQPFGDRAGLASALLGFLQMAGAAVGVVLTASITSATLAIGIVQVALTMLGLILYLTGQRAVPAR